METHAIVKPLYRYMLTALCLIVVVLVWLFLVYFINQDNIAQAEQRVREQQKQIAMIPKLHHEIDQLDTQIKQVRLGIANQQEGLSIKNGQDALSYVFDQIQHHNLTCGSCTIDNEIDKDWYTKHYISLDFKGELVQMLTFFDALKNAHNMVQSTNISLTQAGDAISAKTVLTVSIVK